ncbi:c-type cytochrome biogenesis protein CcsB [Dactylosporangium aurantiacum]|uniref:C-type cytochrome biogenesis protein CcsB n=1 Tax=Dactylosporangium aurantiacum TaxID=35754 RepID=A0A9Q9IFN8_9ACTN|nr:c-type cytochrome biogenesis protein CcsB [Dactylosporangium aurantiacum]MDG6101107.1 c-type cytochrome biogenesis protein CcsB [Dactylosporangium aurantiacum]UWZ54856.1 c-type cytochrome biogenesis protein CcsB [Dactylosporangium aurantiacum]
MGGLSNQLLVVTIFSYVLAMLAYAVEYAFGARSMVGQRVLSGAAAPAEELASVGAGSGSAAGGLPASDFSDKSLSPDTADGSAAARWAGITAVALTLLGYLGHLAALVTRGIAADRAPWGNMYEFVMTATLVGVSAWLVVLAKWRNLRHLGLFVTLVASILLAIAGMTLYVPVGPLVPALQSYWLVIHVGAASIASGIFLVGFVAAAMHLIRLGHDQGKRNFPYSLGERLPQADTLERVTFRVHAFAFPIWTFGVIAGAIWAEAAWGRYWNWDPKEVWSFVAWVVYACYLHARSTPSVSRRVTSWIAIVGWATMLVNLFGVNLVASGLHSYAGV